MRFPGLLCHQSRQACAGIFSPTLEAVTKHFSLCACRNQEQHQYSLKWLLELYSECRLLFLLQCFHIPILCPCIFVTGTSLSLEKFWCLQSLFFSLIVCRLIYSTRPKYCCVMFLWGTEVLNRIKKASLYATFNTLISTLEDCDCNPEVLH